MNLKSLSIISIALLCIIALGAIAGCSSSPHVKVIAADTKKQTNTIPFVKVFLENSGSMDGYMCDGSELKDAIYNYLSALNNKADTMQLYYINSVIIPQKVTLNSYIRNLNPTNFRSAGGNRSHTDISELFNKFLSSVNDKSISIYISDCILDIPNNAAPNYLNITRTDIHNCFTNKAKSVKDLAVCVYQLESSYDGLYYFPKGGSSPYKGKRPYYMILAGPREILAYLRNTVPDSALIHGVKNYCAFSPNYEACASINKGSKYVDEVQLKTKQRDGKYKFDVLVDLSKSLQNDNVLTNPSNYDWLHKNDLSIDMIQRINGNNAEFSHVITFSTNGEILTDVFSLKNIGLPTWVAQSNDSKGDSIDANKTFGIEYIIGGIADAYSDKTSTSFKFNITKK